MGIGGAFVSVGAGSESLVSALTLLADPAKFSERLAQLQAAERSAAEKIALVGAAEDVLSLRKAAETALAEADKVRNDAQVAVNQAALKAQETLQEAQTQAAEVLQRARAQASLITDDAQDRLARVADAERALGATRDALDELSAQVEQRRKDVEAAELSVLNRETQLREERDLLEATRQRLDEALAPLKG